MAIFYRGSNLLIIILNILSKDWQRMINLGIDYINFISIPSFVSNLKLTQPTRLRWRLFLRWIKASKFIMEVRLGIDTNCILAIHALTFRPDTFSFSCDLCTFLASTYTIEKQYEWMKMNFVLHHTSTAFIVENVNHFWSFNEIYQIGTF